MFAYSAGASGARHEKNPSVEARAASLNAERADLDNTSINEPGRFSVFVGLLWLKSAACFVSCPDPGASLPPQLLPSSEASSHPSSMRLVLSE